MADKAIRPARLKLAVLNNSHQVLRLVCKWFQERGHHCATAVVADMPEAHIQVEQFISSIKPDVVIYDVALPYFSSWDLLAAIRELPSMKSQKFVVTTPNKKQLDRAVKRPTPAVELTGQQADMERLLKLVARVAEQPS
jgi:CheY-like chemotaxis protein